MKIQPPAAIHHIEHRRVGGSRLRRVAVLAAAGLIAVSGSVTAVNAAAGAPGSTASARPSIDTVRSAAAKRLNTPNNYSAGLRSWLSGPPKAPLAARRAATPTLGTNVDANDPSRDLAAGQSETAIAAQRRGAATLVLAGWNDISGFLAPATTVAGSITGLGLSTDAGRHFTDLGGLPNNNTDQQWSGDPAITALGDGIHFAVSSLYYPSSAACQDGLPASATIAVSIATVSSSSNAVKFGAPVIAGMPGDVCTLGTDAEAPNTSVLDKVWMSYDPSSSTLALSYTRFYFIRFICNKDGCFLDPNGHTGSGQIEVVRAKVPADPSSLRQGSFGRPVVVWKEEPNCPDGTASSEVSRCGGVDQGAYVAVAPGGDSYLAWERNVNSNLFNGDPSVYLHAALVPAHASAPSSGGVTHPVVITRGQVNATPAGGVKSLDAVPIAGYSRGPAQDFPRVAIDTHTHSVVFAWNDASRHPLGDIYLRSAAFGLPSLRKIAKVNDDNSYALHMLPAVSVRTDGTICTSWYDRTRWGADSTRTDYVADCRPTITTSSTDSRISSGSTDWAGTSSFINPNFGDYTDNATDGTHTYFVWSDGRLGVPQPFTDHR